MGKAERRRRKEEASYSCEYHIYNLLAVSEKNVLQGMGGKS